MGQLIWWPIFVENIKFSSQIRLVAQNIVFWSIWESSAHYRFQNIRNSVESYLNYHVKLTCMLQKVFTESTRCFKIELFWSNYYIKLIYLFLYPVLYSFWKFVYNLYTGVRTTPVALFKQVLSKTTQKLPFSEKILSYYDEVLC